VTNPTLDAALAYAARGLAVFPLNPNSKEPHGLLAPNGFKNASCDPETIKGWWGEFPAANVAIAITPGVMVVDVDPRNGGAETWAALAAGRTIDTMTSISGRGDGGFHLWLNRIDGPLQTKLGPGVDVKDGGKGYIVAPPSIHPDSGLPYTWANDGPINDADDWLAVAVAKPKPAPAPAPGALAPAAGSGTDRPGDDFTAATTWHELLIADGWTPAGTYGAESRWTRPGKTTGISATTNHTGTDRLKVFTSSVPGLDDDGTYDRFGYWAATRHGGNHAAAAVDLAGLGYGSGAQPVDLSWIADAGRSVDLGDAIGVSGDDDPEPHGWEVIDLDDVLDSDYVPPAPELLRRNDGAALLYRGRINALIGESGSGKSWVSQAAIAQSLMMGENVVVVDLEDHRGSYVARLLALGVTTDQVRKQLRYISPEQALGATAGVYLGRLITADNVALVVIDSTGESMALQGVKPNDDDDVARWFRMLPRAVASLGPAVLLLDHLPKSSDAPQGFAIGSQRKRAAIDGAMYRVEVGVAPVKGRIGRLKLVCAKDRAGNWQHGTTVADVTISDAHGSTTVALGVPADPSRPTVLMERASQYLSKVKAASRTQIAGELKGKRDYIYKALDVLIAEGYAAEQRREGRGGGLEVVHVKGFVNDANVAWIPNPANPAQPRPDKKDRVPDDPKTEPRQPRPTYIQVGREGGVRLDRDGGAEIETPPDAGTGFGAETDPAAGPVDNPEPDETYGGVLPSVRPDMSEWI
jgi:hypothetical protein